MDLFLVPNNPERTVLVSLNGVAHYQVTTGKTGNSGRRVSKLQRPAESEADSIIAEIEWKTWENPTLLRSPLFKRGMVSSGAPFGNGDPTRPENRNASPRMGMNGARRLPAPVEGQGVGGRAVGVLANDFLYKRTNFSSCVIDVTRLFVANVRS